MLQYTRSLRNILMNRSQAQLSVHLDGRICDLRIRDLGDLSHVRKRLVPSQREWLADLEC